MFSRIVFLGPTEAVVEKHILILILTRVRKMRYQPIWKTKIIYYYLISILFILTLSAMIYVYSESIFCE